MAAMFKNYFSKDNEARVVKSKVIEIGELSTFDDEPVIILFNDTAPIGLREVCIIHEFEETPPKDFLKKGSKMIFNGKEYTIEKIGHVANETFYDLGHISLYFDYDEVSEVLPGSAFLSPKEKPILKEGDNIEFIT